MAGGRPTKYTPELLEKCRHYRDGGWKDNGDVIPSQVGMILEIDISNATLEKWRTDEDKPEFSRILEQLKANQKQVLINKGLSGDFNSAIAKLVLGKHGYHEKQDVSHSGGIQIKEIVINPVTVDKKG